MLPRRPSRLLVPVLALPLLLAACGGDDDVAAGASSSTTSAPAPSASSAPSVTPSASSAPASSSAPAACAPTTETVPDGAVTAPVDTTTLPGGGDLTGDPTRGPVTLWIASDGATRSLGVVTGSGVVSSVPVESASPVGTTALAANLDGAGPVEVLLDDNRTTSLYAVVDCRLQPVLGPDGQPWQFDRGFRGNGTGVGCTPSAGDGTRSLLGLELAADAQPPTVTSTVVDLDGLTAGIGPSTTADVAGVDDPQAQAATSVTCEGLTLADGLAEPGQ